MKPSLLLLSSNLLKSAVCSAPFAPSAIALTDLPRLLRFADHRKAEGLGFTCAPFALHLLPGFRNAGGFALRRRLFFAKQKSEAAQAKGAEQKEFYAPPLTKKVQNKENHPDKAEKEIGEIL